MSIVLGWLSGKIGAVALGAAIPTALILLKKFIPSKISSLVAGLLGKQVGKIDEIADPVRKGLYLSLALDIVRIVEYELPDKGKGVEKYHAAAEKLCAVLPILKGQEKKIEELIESSVEALDNELKKQIPG